jgi:hypothetical protein
MLHALHPDTVKRWHREGFRRYWLWKRRRQRVGRPPVNREIRSLIHETQFANIVESDEVTGQQIDASTAMCPCQLQANAGEAALPTELFFARGLYRDAEAMPRRRTLHSIIS